MDLLRGAFGATDPAWDIAVTHALLRRVGAAPAGAVSPVPDTVSPGAVLRVYRPQSRVVAFGRRDTRRPGFHTAVDAARAAGFTPVVRPQGGRAVAYTENSLVVDHIHPHSDTLGGMDERFATYGKLWAQVLSEFGIDARVGEVPGEYCPGAYSVNARGVVKLVGTAQRVIKGAWLFSAVAIHNDAEVLRAVLPDVYRALDLPFDVASVGSIRDELPELSLDRLETAVLAEYGTHDELAATSLDAETTRLAHALIDDHRIL
ncbi:lipoate--protein ligase family protein [Haloechinothrix salitolerans]|uniref:Biotin/lipoate A/B protein ligase family protein n=1 Tax=Haloechinothrix salitolerans TaxID=926830 RepID=A0ABW2BY43_9PSEU